MKKQLLGLFAAGFMATIAASAHMEQPDDFQNRNISQFGLTGTKTLALTFDDGPGEGTAQILAMLKKYNVKATFFAVGKNLKAHPQLAQRIVDEGHVLANHSYYHNKLNSKDYLSSPTKLINDLLDTHKQIERFAPNKNFYYFRAPGGNWQNGYANIANSNPDLKKYIGPIYWNVGGQVVEDANGKATDAADWSCWTQKKYINNPDLCLNGYLAKIDSLQGGNVLMHDVHQRTADMFDKMLPILIKKGYKFVTIEEIEELKNYEKVQDDEFFRQRNLYYKNKRAAQAKAAAK